MSKKSASESCFVDRAKESAEGDEEETSHAGAAKTSGRRPNSPYPERELFL